MTSGPFTSHHGLLVAKALEGCWRQDPPHCQLTGNQLEEIAPILLKSGTAALVWWRLKGNGQSDACQEFFEAYKQQTLDAAVHEDDVAQVFRALHELYLDALVVKGWAIARLYPDPGLRHYGDLDLCVRAEQYERVAELLKGKLADEIWIDLHRGVAALDYASESEVFDRSIVVTAGGVSARIPCPEDHLRILCLHLLRHGAWRPLWLCDVALALEASESNFDWKLFFGNDKKRSEWLACVLALSHKLLGARLEGTPLIDRTEMVPNWLTRAILLRWGRWFNSDYRDTAWPSFWSHKWEPIRLWEDIYFRCDPIRATVEMNGAFSRTPRLPYQIGALMRRAPEVAARLFKRTGSG